MAWYSARIRDGPCLNAGSVRTSPGRAGNRSGKTRQLEDADELHLARVLEIVDVEAIRRRQYVVALDACHGSGGRLAVRLLRAMGCRPVVLGGEADGHYDHLPEPTEKNLQLFSALVPAVGAALGFAQDPDADRLAIVDESGHYIGEELTLALAALRRLEQIQGTVVLNLSTSSVTEELARRFGCPVVRTPVGEINVVDGMLAENAVLGGEGNGGVIDPRVGLVRDSFVAMAIVLDLLASSDRPLSRWVEQTAPVCDDQGSVSARFGMHGPQGNHRTLGEDCPCLSRG